MSTPTRHDNEKLASRETNDAPLRMLSIAELPSQFGDFRAIAFTPDARGHEHLAIVRGNVRDLRNVPVRVHSECLTGDVMGSLRCDCREQLQLALESIGKLKAGVVLYLRQEGRGIGLNNKIRAYALQDSGHDTVEANHLLGFGDDERNYRVAADMLHELGVRSVRLMTNNPNKLQGLRGEGVVVSGRIPLVTRATRFNESYLLTKQQRSGHWLGIGVPTKEAKPEHRAEVLPIALPAQPGPSVRAAG